MSMDTVKDDGTLADLTERSVIIAQGGDPDRDTIQDTGDAKEGGDGGKDSPEVMEDAGTTTGQDADAGDGDGGVKDDAKWYGDDDLELAKSYGLDVSALDRFADAAEFERAAVFFDQSLKGKTSDNLSLEQPKPAGEGQPEAKAEDDEIDPQWYAENGYEEETVKIVRALKAERDHRKRLEEHLEGLAKWQEQSERERQQDQHRQFVESFHDAVDALGDDLFGQSLVDGKVVDLGQEADANRRKLFETLMAHGDRFGDVPLRVKVKRALNMEFGDVLRERDKKELIDRVAQQSRKRRPVASANRMRTVVNSPQQPPDNPYDVTEIVGDQQFQREWKRVLGQS